MPTRETIPLVAEAMGATTYEESVDDDSLPAPSKRVQRKLVNAPQEDVDTDPEYMEYQGSVLSLYDSCINQVMIIIVHYQIK